MLRKQYGLDVRMLIVFGQLRPLGAKNRGHNGLAPVRRVFQAPDVVSGHHWKYMWYSIAVTKNDLRRFGSSQGIPKSQ